MKVALKNVNLIHPEQKINEKNISILLTDGKISKIGKLSKEDLDGTKELELENKYVVPGFFDMHVHLREPGREDKETVETGCNSAANGGFTAVACMPNTEPAIDSAEVVNFIKEKASAYLVDVYPVGAATLKREGEVIAPMAELYEAGVVGFSDDGVAIKSASVLRRALEYSSMYNVPIIEHCEDESLTGGAMNEGVNSTMLGLPPVPAVSEDIIVGRDILMAEYTGGRIHIAHISTATAVEMVRQAKKKGLPVTAEVTPHHFTLTDDAVKSYDANAKMSPPLRTPKDVDAMLEGLRDGTIDVIASDHAPHAIEEKETEFQYAPNGIVGLDTEVGLTLSELYHKKILTLEQVIEKLSINPRKICNISIPKFEVGESVDFTILDLNLVWTVDIKEFKSKSKNSPFDKRLLTGKSVGVINNGKLFYNDELISI